MTIEPITLGDIRAAGPCDIGRNDPGGWALLLRTLGEPHGKPDLSRRVSIGDVARSNGPQDALWCLRCVKGLTAQDVMRMILPSIKRAATRTIHQGVADCIAVLNRMADGEDVSHNELRVARMKAAAAEEAEAAAWTAWAAVWLARNAADAALCADTEDASRTAAWAASYAASNDEGKARQVADIIAVSPLLALAE